MTKPTVAVEDLGLVDSRSGTTILDTVSVALDSGTVSGLTGESGSGKTMLMKALLGWLPRTVHRTSGTIHIAGQSVLDLDPGALRALRRTQVSFVGQDAGSALNPVMRVRALLAETASDATAVEHALARVGLPQSLVERRSGELSGGQQRRLALARAVLRDTPILIIDEPFGGLDAQARRTVADLLRSLAHDCGKTILVSGHDVPTLDALVDAHIHLGKDFESTPAESRGTAAPTRPNRLSASGIGLVRGGRTILSNIELTARTGCVTAVLGESGAGKTTLARILAGLEPAAVGQLTLESRPMPLSGRRRGKQITRIQLVPQDPLSTLNPQRTIGQILERPLTRRGIRDRARRAETVTQVLGAVGLNPELVTRRPSELSGGQRQRVSIARALSYNPEVLICDEVTSALDPDTANTIMALLASVAHESDMVVIVIGHDLDLLARHCAEGIVVHEGVRLAAGPVADLLPHFRYQPTGSDNTGSP
ncbi:ABC transporter ATP-binding protein [Nocardia sp. NPDC056000]|uniref:ABC transporter ATP-binding protein n=1 Tax=Nocardia sp. NPDC056000 TaxID=3345674 RepID=UPI0035D9809F